MRGRAAGAGAARTACHTSGSSASWRHMMDAWARRQSDSWSREPHVASSSSVGNESSSSGPPPTTAYVTMEREVDASWCSRSGVRGNAASECGATGSPRWLAAAGDAATGGGGGDSSLSSRRNGCSFSIMTVNRGVHETIRFCG